MARRLWLLAVTVLLGGAWLLQRAPSGRIPRLPVPAPLPARALVPVGASARVVLRDVRFTTSLHARVHLPLLEVVPDLRDLSRIGTDLRIHSIRAIGLSVIAPIDTIITPLDPFTPIPGPRLRIDSISLLDADIGELADPALGIGQWFYHVADLDLELRDVDVAGRRSIAERLRITRLDFDGDFKGERLQVTRAVASLARTPARFDLTLASALGLTAIDLQTRFTPDDDFTLDVVADTIRFAELRAFEHSLPKEGTGKLSMAAARAGDVASLNFRHATAQIGASRIAVKGQLQTGAQGYAQRLSVQVQNLQPADTRRAFDFELPGDGPYNGSITADGALRSGVRVDGAIDGSAQGAPSHLAVNGTIRMDPELTLDLQMAGDPIRLADTAFSMNLRALGPFDTLSIRGDVQLRAATRPPVVISNGTEPGPPEDMRSARADFDLLLLHPADSQPRRLGGRAQLRATGAKGVGAARELASVEGVVAFGSQTTVAARVAADSLPLEVLPWPDAVDSVSGYARGALRIVGELRDPKTSGQFRLHDGALFVEPAKLSLSNIDGPIRLNGDHLVIDGLTGRTRGGTLRASGVASVFGQNKRVDLAVRADSVRVTTRQPHHTASGSVRITGPLDSALATGTIVVLAAATHTRSGTATGSVVLAENGALRVDIAADSLPVGAFPIPADQVNDVTGHMRGRIAVRGTVDEPATDGTLRLIDAGARIRASRTLLSHFGGELRIDDGVLRTDGIRGNAGDGTVVLEGSAGLRGERRLDLRLRADSAVLTDTDSARIIASAALTIEGPLSLPVVNGRAQLVGGWAREDLMKPDPVIDPDDPPYADLAARAPWIRNSRLRPGDRKPDAPPFRGQILVEVTPGIRMIDEDSELYGTGLLRITADSTGIAASGDIRFLGGHYNNFGERFNVSGGGFRLRAREDSRIALLATHVQDELRARNYGSESPLDWYPSLQIFTLGTTATATEQLRRLTPLPQTQTQLGAALIYDLPFDPITGWYNLRFWLPDEKSDFIGERTGQEGGALLWSYAADEAYDYLPLSRAALHASTVIIGSRFPGRIVQGPLFQLSLTLRRHLDLLASLAPEGSALPGLRARWHAGSLSIIAFNEPKFFAAVPAGEALGGYVHRRRTGIGLRWDRDF